jgi:hypothetical protein
MSSGAVLTTRRLSMGQVRITGQQFTFTITRLIQTRLAKDFLVLCNGEERNIGWAGSIVCQTRWLLLATALFVRGGGFDAFAHLAAEKIHQHSVI